LDMTNSTEMISQLNKKHMLSEHAKPNFTQTKLKAENRPFHVNPLIKSNSKIRIDCHPQTHKPTLTKKEKALIIDPFEPVSGRRYDRVPVIRTSRESTTTFRKILPVETTDDPARSEDA